MLNWIDQYGEGGLLYSIWLFKIKRGKHQSFAKLDSDLILYF